MNFLCRGKGCCVASPIGSGKDFPILSVYDAFSVVERVGEIYRLAARVFLSYFPSTVFLFIYKRIPVP